MDVSDTGVVIPALNAEKTIQHVLSGLFDIGFAKEHIFVIDDGSVDKTSEKVRACGVRLVRHSRNQGKGAALKTGFSCACTGSLEAVITMDADGQHRIHDIGLFLEHAHEYDLIIGTRLDVTTMPWLRCVVNRMTSLVISLLSKAYVPDVQCGFRYCKLRLFDRIILRTNQYQTESELVHKALRYHYRVGFVPVTTVYNKERSYIHPVIDTLRFIGMTVGFLWQ